MLCPDLITMQKAGVPLTQEIKTNIQLQKALLLIKLSQNTKSIVKSSEKSKTIS